MLSLLAALFTLSSPPCVPATAQDSPRVVVHFSAEARSEAADGRVLLLFSTAEEGEPRFGVRGSVESAQVFGIDVDGLAPLESVVFGPDVFGHPAVSLSDIPAGEYTGPTAMELRKLEQDRNSTTQRPRPVREVEPISTIDRVPPTPAATSS